jgi:HK97 family phage portal protein
MGFLTSIFGAGGTTRTITTSRDLEQFLLGIGGTAGAGINVSPETAMRFSTVFACVKVIAEDVAKLPLHLYRRRKDGGKERATDHPLSWLMNTRPNPWMSSFNFREMGTGHLALRGNSYSVIERATLGGAVSALIPLHPDRVTVEQQADFALKYTLRRPGMDPKTFAEGEVLHVCGMTLDGITGLSPIAYQRDTVGLAMAASRFGSKVFANGAKMGGFLMTPAKFKDPKRADTLAADFDDKTSGENANKTVVLEEDMKWVKASMTSEDAQYLETRKFQRQEIAGIFRVPPHKIGDLERATFTNIEHQGMEYVTDCLMSYLVRWEQAMNYSLLTPKEQGKYYFEFLVDGLLRGDIASRYTAYQTAINDGIMSPNEVRAKENMNPRQDGLGDRYMRSANTVPADTPVEATSAPAKPGNGDGRDMEEEGDGATQ